MVREHVDGERGVDELGELGVGIFLLPVEGKVVAGTLVGGNVVMDMLVADTLGADTLGVDTVRVDTVGVGKIVAGRLVLGTLVADDPAEGKLVVAEHVGSDRSLKERVPGIHKAVGNVVHPSVLVARVDDFRIVRVAFGDSVPNFTQGG